MGRPFISLVVLAAGESTRFPGGKLVQVISENRRKGPMIRVLIEKYMGLVDDIVVVVGHMFESIVRALAGLYPKFIYNPRYREGMSYSVKTGVGAVLKYSDIVFIHPADTPFIKRETIGLLVEKAVEAYARMKNFVLVPRYTVKGGHPLIVSGDLIEKVLEIKEEEKGLKGFLMKYRDFKIYVDTGDLGVVYDVDTPEDLLDAEKIFGIKWVREGDKGF